VFQQQAESNNPTAWVPVSTLDATAKYVWSTQFSFECEQLSPCTAANTSFYFYSLVATPAVAVNVTFVTAAGDGTLSVNGVAVASSAAFAPVTTKVQLTEGNNLFELFTRTPPNTGSYPYGWWPNGVFLSASTGNTVLINTNSSWVWSWTATRFAGC
jgi:hypothetical protein